MASQVLRGTARTAEEKADDEAFEVSDEQIGYALRQAESSTAVASVCRQLGIRAYLISPPCHGVLAFKTLRAKHFLAKRAPLFARPPSRERGSALPCAST